MHELPIPPDATTDQRARELARVWAAHGQQYVTLATGLGKDPAAWGIMLVDLAKHIANAYEQRSEHGFDDALRRIKAGSDPEWSTATDVPSGRVMD